MFSTTIIVIHKHFQETMVFRNYFFMVKSILHPSGPLSYCFGTATSGKPSTWLPLGELEGQEHLPAIIFHFSDFLKFSKQNIIIL